MSDKKSDSSLNSVILFSDNLHKKKKKLSHKRRDAHKEPEVTAKNVISQHARIKCSDKHISQKIHVENTDFQCIINLKTTVCDHKSQHKLQRTKYTDSRRDKQNTSNSSIPSKVNYLDRKVPKCLRRHCCKLSHYGSRKQRDFYRRNNAYYRDYRRQDRYKNPHKRMVVKKMDKPKPRNSEHKPSQDKGKLVNKQNNFKLLSPISSSPLEDDSDNISYEDISSISLETNNAIPTSTTLVKHKKCKHSKKVKHREKMGESKLDTLIKRTKERERMLVEKSRCTHQSFCTSTPIQDEYSSDHVLLSTSDMDISLNSTLVIETYRNFAYSPSCPIEEQQSETAIYHRAYSPSSPTRIEDYTIKQPSNDHMFLNIKNEPTMDIEAYSPIRSPETTQILAPNDEKVVIKTEMQSPGQLSPTNYKSNSYLQFNIVEAEYCRIEDAGQSSQTDIITNRIFSPMRHESTMPDLTNNNDYKILNIKKEPKIDTEQSYEMKTSENFPINRRKFVTLVK